MDKKVSVSRKFTSEKKVCERLRLWSEKNSIERIVCQMDWSKMEIGMEKMNANARNARVSWDFKNSIQEQNLESRVDWSTILLRIQSEHSIHKSRGSFLALQSPS